jgi:hypothetical protein
MMAAVSRARGSVLEISTSAWISAVRASRSRSASAWATPRAVKPVHPR